jgi:hypothetical protein
MESWYYVVIGGFTLAGLLWLGSRYYVILRIVLFVWGLVIGAAGIVFLGGAIIALTLETSSLLDILQALLTLVLCAAMGVGFLYSAYHLITAALKREDE